MKKYNKAFTLVELIIVIAVIGVLAAILIPIFVNVIEKANNKSAVSDAKNALEVYLADCLDYTGDLVIGEGSVFKIHKADKDWYYTYYDQALHEGTGAQNANALRPIPVPSGAFRVMAEDSYYIAERDADTVIVNSLPNTVIIYNTGAGAAYTPPAEDIETDGEFIVIRRADQLTDEFFSEHGYDGKYKLGNNITLSGTFASIEGEFYGEFDGNGKSITGLTINEPDKTEIGLFRRVDGAVIYNFTLGVEGVTGKGSVGTVCGIARNATFTDIHVVISGLVTDAVSPSDDAFTGMGEVGGFCSTADTVNVARCSVQGRVRSLAHIASLGGMFSYLRGYVSESYFTGTLTADIAGGIASMLSNGTIRACYSRVSFENAEQVCGIANIGINGTSNRILECITVCTGLVPGEYPEVLDTAGFVINYHHSTDVINCYMLAGDELTQHPYTTIGNHENVSLNGTLVSSFSEASCPALNSSETLWDFSGSYPTLIRNRG